jgi:hypothetical protein
MRGSGAVTRTSGKSFSTTLPIPVQDMPSNQSRRRERWRCFDAAPSNSKVYTVS